MASPVECRRCGTRVNVNGEACDVCIEIVATARDRTKRLYGCRACLIAEPRGPHGESKTIGCMRHMGPKGWGTNEPT